jgi:hypothetical protein
MTASKWRLAVCQDGSDERPYQPAWSSSGVPMCSHACSYFDGKRCEALGLRPGSLCEPAVSGMAWRLEDAENGTDAKP